MTRKTWFILNLLIAAALLLAACAPAPTEAPPPTQAPAPEEPVVEEPAAEMIPINLRLSWLVKGEFAPMFAARELGYFAEQGLDVTILEGSADATPMQLLASGDDQFAYIGANDMIEAQSQGIDLVLVADYLQKHPQAVSAIAPLENDDPTDMEGKTVGTSPGSTLTQVWDAFLKSQGMAPDAAELVVLDFGALIPAFLNGEVDMISSFSTNDIPIMEVDQGVDINYWLLGDFGFNLLAHGIVTSREYMEANPEIVRGVVVATQRAVKWIEENPEEAGIMMHDLFPDTLPREATIRQLEETAKLFYTPNTIDKPYGYIAEEDMERTISLMFDNGVIEERLPNATDYYDLQFLDMSILPTVARGN